ncbi:MAG: S41 family peptidase [Bacteroidetes bacterium]|nr:S41 family peptidase [Bacteroidota bacterium]
MRRLMLSLFLLSTVPVTAQNVVSISVEKLAEDVDYFFSALEETHPDLYYYHSKDSVLQVKEAIKQQLVAPMSRFDFERLMALRTNYLFDGHTGLKWHFEEWETIPDSAFLFPQTLINVMQGNLFLNENATQRILTINNQPINEIVATMRSLIGDDQTSYSKDCRIEENFSTYYYHLFGSSVSYTLTFEQQEKTIKRIFQGVKKYDVYHNNELLPFELTIRDTIALLTINDFDLRYLREFPIFLDSCFTQIAKSRIEYLFIDVSENVGGSSDNVNLLLDYLYPAHYYFLDGYGIRRYSENYIDNYRWYFNNRYNDIEEAEKAYNTWKSSIKSEYETESYVWERVNEVTNAYLGKLFVLQSYKTFSASLEFTSAIKSSNRGILIGEPTSNPAFCFTDQIGLRMPNTNIFFGCASAFYAVPSGNSNANVGILPDVFCHHRDLGAIKNDSDTMFKYLKSIVAQYGNRQNSIEILDRFQY